MKYKVGDKVRIVGNKTNHGFNTNDIVIIEEIRDVGEKEGVYVASCFDYPGEAWFVTESDVDFFMSLADQFAEAAKQTPIEVPSYGYIDLGEDKYKSTPVDVVDKYYKDLVKDIMNSPQITKDDPVESPSHYSSDKIECVDYLKDNMPFEAYLGGLEWNVKKYLHRWRRKGKPVEDLRKASWYLNRLINELES